MEVIQMALKPHSSIHSLKILQHDHPHENKNSMNAMNEMKREKKRKTIEMISSSEKIPAYFVSINCKQFSLQLKCIHSRQLLTLL